MTVHTATTQPGRFVTLEEWENLEWPEGVRYELVEGRLVEMPSASRAHNDIAGNLRDLLKTALPRAEWKVLAPGVEVPVPAKAGATRRIPDVSVIRKAVFDADPYNNGCSAEDTLLVVEVVSPGSVRTDYLKKHAEYARAGVPHYWIFDVRPEATEPRVTILKLVDGRYEEQPLDEDGAAVVALPAGSAGTTPSVDLRFAFTDLLD